MRTESVYCFWWNYLCRKVESNDVIDAAFSVECSEVLFVSQMQIVEGREVR